MAPKVKVTIAASSPKGDGEKKESFPSPKSGGGQCLCSPTTHQGSFRCRFHRSQSSAWMRRSNSMSSIPKSHGVAPPMINKPLQTAQ